MKKRRAGWRRRRCTRGCKGGEAHGGWRRRRLLECAGAKATRSGIIYGATCKVRKITPASAGFAETTLVYATDPSGRTQHRAVPRAREKGRCLRVFQPGYVLRSFSTTNNLSGVRKDYLLYRSPSEISRANRMFVHSKNIEFYYFSLIYLIEILRNENSFQIQECVTLVN